MRIHASSGTTGRPTVVGYTQRDIDNWADIVARCLRAGGATAKDKVHVAYGYGLFTGGLGAHYGAERLGATVIPMSGGQTERRAQLILDFKPDIIMVTPSYCLTLIDELERKMGGDARGCSLRLGVFGAEPRTEALRHEIETRMGIKALDIYGLSEVMGPGVAMECLESGGGPTIWEDHFLPEIICPETGVALPDGEHGELVFTTLTKEALPVIRYRTRDLTRLLPGDARQMRRMGKITGRSDDMLIIRGVNVFPSQVEEQIMQFEQLSPHYQLQVSRSGHRTRWRCASSSRSRRSASATSSVATSVTSCATTSNRSWASAPTSASPTAAIFRARKAKRSAWSICGRVEGARRHG